jgi:hypothetical protein
MKEIPKLNYQKKKVCVREREKIENKNINTI